MADFNDAVAEYIRREFKYKPTDTVTDVDFGIGRGGYCETCGYEYVALEFKVNGKWADLELDYSRRSAGDFVAAVAEIHTELNSR